MRKGLLLALTALMALALVAAGCGGKKGGEAPAGGGGAPAAEPPKAEAPKEEAPKAEAPKEEAPKAEAGGGGDAAKGKDIYGQKCAACHGANGEGAVGPNFAAKDGKPPVSERLDEAATIQTVTDGRNAMPAFKGQLSDDDIKNVVAYIRSLK